MERVGEDEERGTTGEGTGEATGGKGGNDERVCRLSRGVERLGVRVAMLPLSPRWDRKRRSDG